MINSVHFRRQVGAVMEILTKAAIAEIAKLVDDGSAVLRLEMYRTQSENETLKAKMEQMESELEAARGRGQAAGLREPPGSTRSVGVQAFQELKEEKQSKMKYAEELCVSVWSERRPAGPNEREPLYNTAPGVEEDRPETHIKQEMLDDDWWNSDPQRWLDVNREGSAERLHDDQNAGEITQTLSEEPKVLCEPQGAEINDQELDGLPFGMKMESWKVCTAQKPNLTEEEYRTGRLNGVTTEYAMDGKISQLWTTFVQDSCTEPGDPPQKSQEDLPLAPAHFNCGNPSLAVNVKLRVGTLDSMATNEDVAAPPVCRNEPIPQTRQSREKPTPGRRVDVTIPGRQQHYGGPANKMVASENTEGLETGSPNRYVHMLSGTSFNMTKMLKTCRKACTEEKPFRCSHCGRSFSRLTCLKIHQRSHTGEKPYSCLECGRQFTQQKSLKTHQSVHTGERPFSCTLCGKRFSRQDNCTRHERFHSGKKPFSCKQCGKCFTLQSNLKTHQQIHCGFNRFIFA